MAQSQRQTYMKVNYTKKIGECIPKPKAGSINTRIMACTCKHEFQDTQYGKGKRVFNKQIGDNKWACSVCGKSHAV